LAAAHHRKTLPGVFPQIKNFRAARTGFAGRRSAGFDSLPSGEEFKPDGKRSRGGTRFAWRALAVCVSFALVYIFIGEAAVVPTASMEGTILVGDHILLDKFLYGPSVPFTTWHLPTRRAVSRGSIIAFKFPLDTRMSFLKRVAAVGGDTVEIRDDILFVNDKPVTEAYVVHTHTKGRVHNKENMARRVIPRGQLFVLGDNRDNSDDSRDWGNVPLGNVIGEPLLVYWSYDAPSAAWLDEHPFRQLRLYSSAVVNLFTHTRWARTGVLL
jgi:signal peptidase I